MKRSRTRTHEQTIRVWSYDEARTVLPYVASVVRSLREHRLNAQQHELTARRLDAKPGKPNRSTLLALEETRAEAGRAKEAFEEALEELNALDIYSLDPLLGQALIPFAHGDQLAWYIYDLFAEGDLSFWRFHTDPLDARRPLAELEALPIETATV